MPVPLRRPYVDPTRAAQMAVAARNGDFVVRLPSIVENAARMVLGNVGLLVKKLWKWGNINTMYKFHV